MLIGIWKALMCEEENLVGIFKKLGNFVYLVVSVASSQPLPLELFVQRREDGRFIFLSARYIFFAYLTHLSTSIASF